MKYQIYSTALITGILITIYSCTKLDQKIYSVTSNSNFWQTEDQINAGIAPAYQALQKLPNADWDDIISVCTDERIVLTRGGDWYDGGKWQVLWMHTWTPSSQKLDGAWNAIFNGVGKINYILSQLGQLTDVPTGIDLSLLEAQLKVLRCYYYYLAVDVFGNVPYVTDYEIDINSVTNTPRSEIYTALVDEISGSLDMLPEEVSSQTYGKVTKWFGYALLAKLYLNADVFSGNAEWEKCIAACDAIINSGKYSLETSYLDNFKVDNETSSENIFVIPFDATYITGFNYQGRNLHYDNRTTFGLLKSSSNGFSMAPDFYRSMDTTSVYSNVGGNTYRTYLDQRNGQFLFGQQYSVAYPYPSYQNILVETSDESLKLHDASTGLPLSYYNNFNTISSAADSFRMAGIRNIKYFPEAGSNGNQSNDFVIFRLADFMMMKAEAKIRSGQPNAAIEQVNPIIERAYGNSDHNWTTQDATLDNLLAERGKELCYEPYRRNDLIRYGKFGEARNPGKQADADRHFEIFPIPYQIMLANPNLIQNPGYQQ